MTDVNSTTTDTFLPSCDLVSIAVGFVHLAPSVYHSMRTENSQRSEGTFAVGCFSVFIISINTPTFVSLEKLEN